jgi:hypothetical protein
MISTQHQEFFLSINFELINENIPVSGTNRTSKPDKCHCRDDCNSVSCLNYLTHAECINCHDRCRNNRFQRCSPRSLQLKEVVGKGHGIFALEEIAKDDLIVEYLGEIIGETEYFKRVAKLNENRELHLYFMQLEKKNYIDSRYKGSLGRFLNHSCEPNAQIAVWNVGGKLRLGIFAERNIHIGEEITADYQWKLHGRPPTRCYCRTPSCRGFLEVFKQQDMKKILELRGTWISCLERRVLKSDRTVSNIDQSISSIFDPHTGNVIPSKIIGKYLKILYDDNNQFQECRVESYLEDLAQYMVLDIFRKYEYQEDLNNPQKIWYYLDENLGTSSLRLQVSETK